MDSLKHWDILFQKHKMPCLLAEIKTNKVIYINDEMKKLFENRQEVVGQEYYNVIKSSEMEKSIINWDSQDILEAKVYDKSFDMEFNITYTKIDYKNDEYVFCKYEYSDKKTIDKHGYEETMAQCMSILQSDEQVRTPRLLKLLGEFYNAQKTYLYKIDNDKMPSVYYWRKNEQVKITEELTDIISIEELVKWFETKNEVGIIEASKNHKSFKEGDTEAKILQKINLENIVMYVIEDVNKKIIGAIAISNRENTMMDLRLLQVVSKFLETDISKTGSKVDVKKLNNIDLLTGFYSRMSYSEKVDNLHKNPPKKLGVIFANVNGLKKINSEFGYAKGDSYIKKASEIIKEHFKSDFFRISGDEFVAFLDDINKQTLEASVLELQEKLKKEDKNFFALGHAYGEGRVDTVALIKEADTVMYINKQEYYHTSQRRFQEISDSTLSDLLSYLDNDEFMIYLQPQVTLKDGKLYGAEALIRRFDKKNQKMVFPDQFIALYEKKSVIRHVDIFVIEEVCKLLAKWSKTNQQIPISVNLSRVTLLEYGIVDTIAKICDKYEISRELLIIEVTERVGLIENNVASSLITEFKDRGFKISLDDFGCAYSNIVTLAQIEVDEVKLDKSLVDNIATNKKNYVLVKNVLSMCNELEGASTLAEGIEDEEQSKLLHDLGCHLGQGYYYSRPIPVSEFCEKYID